MLMATARRYTLEQIEAARKKLRSLPMKEAGKTRGEVAEFLVNDIRKAMRQGYTLRDIRDLLADAGVSVPLTKLKALFDKAPGLEPVRERDGAEKDTPPPHEGNSNGECGRGMTQKEAARSRFMPWSRRLLGMGQMVYSFYFRAPVFSS